VVPKRDLKNRGQPLPRQRPGRPPGLFFYTPETSISPCITAAKLLYLARSRSKRRRTGSCAPPAAKSEERSSGGNGQCISRHSR
jgi:hypothetical protein